MLLIESFYIHYVLNPGRSHAASGRIETFGRTSESRTSETQADTVEVFLSLLYEVVAVI